MRCPCQPHGRPRTFTCDRPKPQEQQHVLPPYNLSATHRNAGIQCNTTRLARDTSNHKDPASPVSPPPPSPSPPSSTPLPHTPSVSVKYLIAYVCVYFQAQDIADLSEGIWRRGQGHLHLECCANAQHVFARTCFSCWLKLIRSSKL